ncbi:hypothetical protein Tco_0816184 [Tanacetum coccineum]
MEADDQAIQTILLSLPEDIYAVVDSCETAQEIWLRVLQMMKGSDIGIQEKKAKLFNEWDWCTSLDGGIGLSLTIIISQKWCRHVTIVHETKDLHTADYTQLYDFLKYNQKGVDDLRAERLAKTHDPLVLMENSNNPFNYPVFHPDQLSPNPKTAMNMTLVLMAKAFKPNYSTPTNNNQRISSNPHNRQLAQPGMNMGQDRHMQMVEGNSGNQFREYAGQNVRNQNGYNTVQTVRNQNPNGNGNVVAARAMDNAIENNADLDEIEEVNANCILMANLQQASTSGTQTDKALVYDSDGSAEVHHYDNCYNNDIFNMFTQEEQYTDLFELILELHQVQQNDNVISGVSSVEQSGGTVDQHSATVEETRAYHESLFHNLATEVEKVNLVNCKMNETNAKLTTKLARYKNQEKCFEISQEKYDKLERCYQKSVYQEQCLTKKINALHLSSGKQITALNEEISNLNKQLSKEKAIVSFFQEAKKRLKSDFKICEDEFLDKQIQLENKIKELDNILVKTGQSIQTMHMLSPKPDSFNHIEQKMALGYQNPFYLKQAQQKQQSLYNGKVLLEKHDPPAVCDSEETLELAQETDESLAKHKALELEIQRLLRVVVSQDIMSIVQINYVVDTSNLQTELEPYNDMQQKIKWLQAQLGDQKGKSKDTQCVSNTLDLLPQKLENENVELEFQIRNYEKENAHLMSSYRNLFDFVNVSRAQTKGITDSLQKNDMIYENMTLRAQLSDKVSEQKDTTKGTSLNT